MEVRHLVRGVNSAGAYVRSTHLRDNTYSEFGGASLEAIAHDRNIDTDCVSWKLRTCNPISIISVDTFLGGCHLSLYYFETILQPKQPRIRDCKWDADNSK
jgi:hypothetical protein